MRRTRSHPRRCKAAGGDRLAQGGQLATRLAGVGVHGRHRPAQILDQADHRAALIGQAGVVSLSSGGLPDVCSGAGRNTCMTCTRAEGAVAVPGRGVPAAPASLGVWPEHVGQLRAVPDVEDPAAHGRRPWPRLVLSLWYATAVILLGGGIGLVIGTIGKKDASSLSWVAAGILLLWGALVLAGTIVEHRRGRRVRWPPTRPPASK